MKKNIIIIFFICLFINVSPLLAKSSYTCDSNVYESDSFKCSVTIDKDAVLIKSDYNIKVLDIEGNKYSKINDYEVIFYSDGVVTYDKASDKYKSYVISLYDEKGFQKYLDDKTINVIRKTTTTTTTKLKSSNNYLKSISINNNLIPNFSKSETRYHVTYEYDVSKVSFNYETEDINAIAEINGPNKLEVGDNEYTIGVTAEDGNIRYYKVLVTRKDKPVVLSNNNYLKKLKIKGYQINFKKEVKTYHLTIKSKVSKLDIYPKTDDANASYEILGNSNLKNESIIEIKVTAQNSDIRIYRIIINKKKSINTIYIICPVLLLTLLVIMIVLRSKNKYKKPKNNSEKGTQEVTNDTKELFKIDNLNNEIISDDTSFKDNSIESIIKEIQQSISDDSYESKISDYLIKLDEFDNKDDVIKALFNLIQDNYLYDFGTPGVLTNYIESFDTIYEGYLVKSIKVRPAIVSIWMLNRCINANENIDKYKSILDGLLLSDETDNKIKNYINKIYNKK